MSLDLYVVFGGELKDPQKVSFLHPEALHIIGIFPNYDDAHLAWKAAAQRTVDNAHMRYFIAQLPPLCENKHV